MEINDEDMGIWIDLQMDWIDENEIKNTEKNSLLIVSSNAIDILVYALNIYKRDYDVLVEPLGIIKTTSFLQQTKSSDVIFSR